MEFLNTIRLRKKIRIKFINDSKYTALYIVKIYCKYCRSICYSQSTNCSLEFDLIMFNDVGHLGDIISIKQ